MKLVVMIDEWWTIIARKAFHQFQAESNATFLYDSDNNNNNTFKDEKKKKLKKYFIDI